MITLYGIPNCDTVKKARTWLNEHGVVHQFHDFKKLGVPEEALDRWIAALGWEPLINRKGTTWRNLDDETRSSITAPEAARKVIACHTSVIKRPVVEWANGEVSVGFSADEWARSTSKR